MAKWVVWTAWQHRDIPHLPVLLGFSAAAAVFLVAAWVLNMVGKEGWAFGTMALTIVMAVGAILSALFPNVMPSSIDPAYSLTIENASSTEYTLTVMSWVALFAIPLVILYQGWTYWVFRKRITRDHIPVGASH